jgi:hypothetical protein
MRNTSLEVLSWDRIDAVRACPRLPRFPSVSQHPPGARGLGERKDVVRGKRVTGHESQQVGGLQEGYWGVQTEDRHAQNDSTLGMHRTGPRKVAESSTRNTIRDTLARGASEIRGAWTKEDDQEDRLDVCGT